MSHPAGGRVPYGGVDTLLKSSLSDPDAVGNADVAALGIPFDGGVSYRSGARHGPKAIRRASEWWGYAVDFDNGLYNTRTGERVDHGRYSLVDCGDAPVYPTDLARTTESVREAVAEVAMEAFPVVLGGDHYCTYPALCGLADGRDFDTLGLVQLDAHADIVEGSDLFGGRFHGTSTRLIAESEVSNFRHVSQVGLRAYERADFPAYAEERGMTVHTMADVDEMGIDRAVREAVEAAADGTDGVYVTFDADVLDPSVAPGVGNPVPGGFDAREALRAMELLGGHEAVRAVDFMEVAPPHDPTGTTARLVATLLLSFVEARFATLGGT